MHAMLCLVQFDIYNTEGEYHDSHLKLVTMEKIF